MYVPSNILRLPSITLFADNTATGGVGTIASFLTASTNSNYQVIGLENNPNWSIDATGQLITVTKKTLIRASMKPQPCTVSSVRFQFGIFDNSTSNRLGTEGGFDWLSAANGNAAWPNGGNLSHVHNTADAIVDANTTFNIKITFVTSTAIKGFRNPISYIQLYQLED